MKNNFVKTIQLKDFKKETINLYYIPDTQIHAGVSLDFLSSIGQHILEIKPDVIVLAGDHFDLPSLSSYDIGKLSAEGKRLSDDIRAGIEGLKVLLQPIKNYQDKMKQQKNKVWKPVLFVTLGNHEQRLQRYIQDNPSLKDFLSYDSFKYEEHGFEVFDFLEPVIVNNVKFSHFMPNPTSGKPIGSAIETMIKQIGMSFVCGHTQILKFGCVQRVGHSDHYGIVAGASYIHDEGYKGYTNDHWRGTLVLRNLNDGVYDLETNRTTELMKKYIPLKIKKGNK